MSCTVVEHAEEPWKERWAIANGERREERETPDSDTPTPPDNDVSPDNDRTPIIPDDDRTPIIPDNDRTPNPDNDRVPDDNNRSDENREKACVGLDCILAQGENSSREPLNMTDRTSGSNSLRPPNNSNRGERQPSNSGIALAKDISILNSAKEAA